MQIPPCYLSGSPAHKVTDPEPHREVRYLYFVGHRGSHYRGIGGSRICAEARGDLYPSGLTSTLDLTRNFHGGSSCSTIKERTPFDRDKSKMTVEFNLSDEVVLRLIERASRFLTLELLHLTSSPTDTSTVYLEHVVPPFSLDLRSEILGLAYLTLPRSQRD